MAIHYNGSVQRTPGRVACNPVLPTVPAAVQQWRSTTCGQCMIRGLMGLKIIHVEPGSIPGDVVNVSRHEIGVRFLPDEPAPTALAMSELDTGNWQGYQEEPEPEVRDAD